MMDGEIKQALHFLDFSRHPGATPLPSIHDSNSGNFVVGVSDSERKEYCDLLDSLLHMLIGKATRAEQQQQQKQQQRLYKYIIRMSNKVLLLAVLVACVYACGVCCSTVFLTFFSFFVRNVRARWQSSTCHSGMSTFACMFLVFFYFLPFLFFRCFTLFCTVNEKSNLHKRH